MTDCTPPDTRALTHGRHCPCSACAREDWPKITAPCGMHGPSCPAVYAPVAASGQEIEVVPHTHTRTIPRYYNHSAHEWMDERTFEEADADFPYMARSGSVCAIGRTREGAVSMVETIMEARRV